MASEAALARDQYAYMAKLAEQAERYEEMVQFVDKLVIGTTPSGELTAEEMNLLSVAYKNVIGSLPAAWRIVSAIEQKEEGRRNDEHVALINDYRFKLESEPSNVCASILKLLVWNVDFWVIFRWFRFMVGASVVSLITVVLLYGFLISTSVENVSVSIHHVFDWLVNRKDV